MLAFIFSIIALFIALVNTGFLIYMLKNHSEKLTLLSHIALQYLNEKETVQTKEELNSKTVRVTNTPFNLRRSR